MRKAAYSDKQLVSEILVSAFSSLEGKNSINFVVKQDNRRIERMYVLMKYLFEKTYRFGEIYISDNNKACILLTFSDKEEVNLKTILLDITLAVKCIGIERVWQVYKRQRLDRNFPKEKHIRPLILGVKEECKGNGTAARLMLQVRDKFKHHSVPVILDVASEKNMKLYQRFGFEIFKKDETLGFPIYFLRLN